MADAVVTTIKKFKSVGAIFVDLSSILKPAEQLSVSDAAERWRRLNNPGAYVGKWFNHKVQPMVEPMNTYTSRLYNGMVFVGPAQSAKTDTLCINTLVYSIMVDPMDMMLFCPTNTDGRDFSIRRIDRMHRHSPDVGALLGTSSDADNKFDKQYINGMLFTIGWPTASQVAGKPIGKVVITDRDRMPDDIDGDGEIFDLASKRTTTFGSYAMTVVESSPSRPILDPKWIARTPHEAPPCEGILKLYNRGDRRRWHWPCPDCNQFFEGNFKMLEWDTEGEMGNLERAESVRMVCPHCSYKIKFDERDEMQQWGLWLKEGQGIDNLGRVFGPAPRTAIASFWLNGVAAAFATWKKLVSTYLDASDEWTRTGSEEALKKFYNNDLGEPYRPKSDMDEFRTPEMIMGRAELGHDLKRVPAGGRFLIATIDVQRNRFIVQVHAIFPGLRFDSFVVDRFEIQKSKRLDHDGDPLWVKPGTYPEDWDLITEQVIDKEYLLDDDSGRKMAIRFTGCDSGGQEGATSNAYTYYRRLRAGNKHRRFILVKGDGTPNSPRTQISYPDAQKKDILNAPRGDVPVLRLNSNLLKDDLNGRLDALSPGTGMFRTPAWLSDSFYAELCAEVRTPKGWMNDSNARNESWDLGYYMIGLMVSELIKIEHFDWTKPPGWAAEWDDNLLVSEPEAPSRIAPGLESPYDFAAFGKSLA